MMWRIVLGAALVLLASGCGSDTSAPAVSVNGFGATVADWNAQYSGDPNATIADPAYDPMPNLPGGYRDRYYGVSSVAGHITRYEMAFSPISESAARGMLLQEFPSDATVRWFKRLRTCAEMEIHSKALGRALSSHAIGDNAGEGYVELVTGMMPGDGYNPQGVNGAIVELGSYKTPAAAPAC
jgi:hypothetical protein